MKFELSADEWHFTIEVTLNPDFKPEAKFASYSHESLQSWREGSLGFYNLFVTSRNSTFGDDLEMTHYVSGILLPQDPDELQDELEHVLEEDGYIEHILKHWELHELSSGPEWKKG